MTGKKVAAEGTVLLQLRRKAGWTQARLERTARLSRGVISLYETGRRPLNRQLLGRLAGTLGLALEDVGGASPELAKVGPNFDAPQALTPASLLPHEQRAVEAAAERAAARVRLGVGTRLIEARLRSERMEASNLWDQLRKLPNLRAWRERIDIDSRFRSWAFCELLCSESSHAAARDVATSRVLSRLALKVAEKTSGSDAWRCKVQGYAWAFVANSLRVTGTNSVADGAIQRAFEFWKSADPPAPAPLDESQLPSLAASLRVVQGRFSEANDLLITAEEFAHQASQKAPLRLKHALLIGRQGAYEEALDALEAAEGLIAETHQPRLIFNLEHTRAIFFYFLCQFEHARRSIGLAQRLVLESGNEIDVLRTSWVSAKIDFELGHKSSAIEQIEKVHQVFLRKGLTADAKFAALDLVELRKGRGCFRPWISK